MGIENIVKNMNKKKRKLFLNIISILMIVVIGYGALMGANLFLKTGNYMSLFSGELIASILIPMIFLWLAYKLLRGEPLNLGNKQVKAPSKPKRRTSNTKPRRKKKPHITAKKPKSKPIKGSWKCPKCGYLVVGISKCPKCGHRK